MRALLVAAAPAPGSSDLVARLAYRCDLVIAVDGGGLVCLDAGVTPDVVVGDFDSLPADALERLEALGARVSRFSAHKDETDLELALAVARRAGATEVIVTCSTTGRLDHTLAALGALADCADLMPELAEPDVTGWILSPEGRAVLRLDGVGATISLLALSGAAVVSASGVEWPLVVQLLVAGSGLGVSNIINAEEGATVRAIEGTLLVLAPAMPSSASARPHRGTA